MPDRAILEVDSFELGGLRVPAFRLPEQAVLRLLRPDPDELRKDLIARLTGLEASGAVRLRDDLVATYPLDEERFTGLWLHNRQSVKRWIARRLKLAPAGASALAEELGLDPDSDWVGLRGTENALLGIEVGFRQSRNIIFTTSGLDPLGMQQVEARVDQELRGAALELLWSERPLNFSLTKHPVVRCQQS